MCSTHRGALLFAYLMLLYAFINIAAFLVMFWFDTEPDWMLLYKLMCDFILVPASLLLSIAIHKDNLSMVFIAEVVYLTSAFANLVFTIIYLLMFLKHQDYGTPFVIFIGTRVLFFAVYITGVLILMFHHKRLSGEDEYVIYAEKKKHFGVDDSGEDVTDVSRYRGGKHQESDEDDVACNEVDLEDTPKTGMPKKARLENYLPTGEYAGKFDSKDTKSRPCLPTHYLPPLKGQRLPASPIKCFKHNYRSVAPCVRNIDIPQGPSMYERQSEAKVSKTKPQQISCASSVSVKSTCCGGGDIMELMPDGRDAGSCVLVKKRQNAAALMRRCATPLVARNSTYAGYQNYPSRSQSSICPPVPPRSYMQPRQSVYPVDNRVDIGCNRGSAGYGSVQVSSGGSCQPGIHNFSKPKMPKGPIVNPGFETQLCPHKFHAGKSACCAQSLRSAGVPHTSACLPPEHSDAARSSNKCMVPDLCLLDDKKFDLCPKPLLPPCGHIECAAPVELDAPRKVDIRILERPPPREHEIRMTHFDSRTNLMTKYGVDLPDAPCHYSNNNRNDSQHEEKTTDIYGSNSKKNFNQTKNDHDDNLTKNKITNEKKISGDKSFKKSNSKDSGSKETNSKDKSSKKSNSKDEDKRLKKSESKDEDKRLNKSNSKDEDKRSKNSYTEDEVKSFKKFNSKNEYKSFEKPNRKEEIKSFNNSNSKDKSLEKSKNYELDKLLVKKSPTPAKVDFQIKASVEKEEKANNNSSEVRSSKTKTGSVSSVQSEDSDEDTPEIEKYVRGIENMSWSPCPEGLQALIPLDQFVIRKKVLRKDSVIDKKIRRKFAINNILGEELLNAIEMQRMAIKYWYGVERSFEMIIQNELEQNLIILSRVKSTWKNYMNVYCPFDELIGTIHEEKNICFNQFVVKNVYDDVILKIVGKCHWCSAFTKTIPTFDFKILDPDGDYVGTIKIEEIDNHFGQLIVTFPWKIDVKMKAIMLASSIFIEIILIEAPKTRCDSLKRSSKH